MAKEFCEHMKIVLKDKDNQVVFANTDATCLFCLLSHASEGESKVIKCAVLCRKTRCICCINGDYTALLCSGKSEDVNSSKAIKHKVAACFDIWDAMVHFAETTEAQTISYINKLTHNLVSIQARNTQEMFALIPQEKLTGDIHGQISAISSIITSNSVKASQTLLQLIKNNLAMKSEFTSSIFLFPNRKLIEKKIRLTFKNHPIRNVLLNVAHAFFSDFTDHGVTINVGECQATVKLDYDTFRVALFHVIDNATKYIQPHSNFDIEEALAKVQFGVVLLQVY